MSVEKAIRGKYSPTKSVDKMKRKKYLKRKLKNIKKTGNYGGYGAYPSDWKYGINAGRSQAVSSLVVYVRQENINTKPVIEVEEEKETVELTGFKKILDFFKKKKKEGSTITTTSEKDIYLTLSYQDSPVGEGQFLDVYITPEVEKGRRELMAVDLSYVDENKKHNDLSYWNINYYSGNKLTDNNTWIDINGKECHRDTIKGNNTPCPFPEELKAAIKEEVFPFHDTGGKINNETIIKFLAQGGITL